MKTKLILIGFCSGFAVGMIVMAAQVRDIIESAKKVENLNNDLTEGIKYINSATQIREKALSIFVDHAEPATLEEVRQAIEFDLVIHTGMMPEKLRTFLDKDKDEE